jgi:hypothetical protein
MINHVYIYIYITFEIYLKWFIYSHLLIFSDVNLLLIAVVFSNSKRPVAATDDLSEWDSYCRQWFDLSQPVSPSGLINGIKLNWKAGWWFQTFFMFHHILGIIPSH